MKRVTLGRNGPEVSAICLGTMTWGTQNTEAEGHAQMDMALDLGVDFWDTAEMYPTNPVSEETIGGTEEIIGSWFASRGGRDAVKIATKIAGQGGKARGGEPITPTSIHRAVDASLQRLRTDRIDLYQFHWPNRGSYHFRQNWGFDASKQDRAAILANLQDCLGALADLQAEGKIVHWGLSNETAWGMMQWIAQSDASYGPRPVSVQNEYSLLCRLYDTDMAEMGVNERVTLLAYSPLATGILTGKYADGATPAGSRRSRTPDLGGRITPRMWPAAEAYVALARRHGLDPAQMAIAWTMTRPFPIIPIIGATSLEQLKLALTADQLVLSEELRREIEAIHKAHPLPY